MRDSNQMSEADFLVNPDTGRRFPVGGCIISDTPSDAPKYGSMREIRTENLPPSVDLRQWMTPIEEQLNTQAW